MCQVGEFVDVNYGGKCNSCPVGTYQGSWDFSGTECTPCPKGKSTPMEGAFTVNQCSYIVPASSPQTQTTDIQSTGIIPGYAIALIILGALIAAISCCWLGCARVRRRNALRTTLAPQMAPRVIVQPLVAPVFYNTLSSMPPPQFIQPSPVPSAPTASFEKGNESRSNSYQPPSYSFA